MSNKVVIYITNLTQCEIRLSSCWLVVKHFTCHKCYYLDHPCLFDIFFEISGAHTIGKARCVSYRDRIYNENNIDSLFAKARQKNCPKGSSGTPKDNNVAPLDFKTPNHFDNEYFKNLINKKGLLRSDQELFNGGSTDSLVRTYSNNQRVFEADFVTAMIKMGNIKPLTGSNGQIRKQCRRPN